MSAPADLGVVTYADIIGARAMVKMKRRAGVDVPADIARMAAMDEHAAPLGEELVRERRTGAVLEQDVPLHDLRDDSHRESGGPDARSALHGSQDGSGRAGSRTGEDRDAAAAAPDAAARRR